MAETEWRGKGESQYEGIVPIDYTHGPLHVWSGSILLYKQLFCLYFEIIIQLYHSLPLSPSKSLCALLLTGASFPKHQEECILVKQFSLFPLKLSDQEIKCPVLSGGACMYTGAVQAFFLWHWKSWFEESELRGKGFQNARGEIHCPRFLTETLLQLQ